MKREIKEVDIVSENIIFSPESGQLNISARRIIGMAALRDNQIVFQQEGYMHEAGKTKYPLRLYIINHGADISGSKGSPVKSVKLCKRLIEPESPEIVLISKQNSKITLRFQIVLIVEFENGNFDVIKIPNQISLKDKYYSKAAKAFVEDTVIDRKGIPIVQRENKEELYDTFVIKKNKNEYCYFEYSTILPLSNFNSSFDSFHLDDPTLQSMIFLENLRYDIQVRNAYKISFDTFDNGNDGGIWTTITDISLFEDIISKIGIEQDIIIPGKSVEK